MIGILTWRRHVGHLHSTKVIAVFIYWTLLLLLLLMRRRMLLLIMTLLLFSNSSLFSLL